jgi:hypothetical protein
MALISSRVSIGLGLLGAALALAGFVLYAKAPEQKTAINATELAAVA